MPAARAAAPGPERARIAALREQIRADRKKLKAIALDQHAALELDRARERDGARLVKASAASPETIHLDLWAVHEKSRRERRDARQARREARAALLARIKRARDELRLLRRKK